MGFWDRFRRRKNVDFGDDVINDIWENVVDDLPRGALSHFIEQAEDVFSTAFVDEDVDSEERKTAREEFENLMAEYAIDVTEFDWDAWRDWYEQQS